MEHKYPPVKFLKRWITDITESCLPFIIFKLWSKSCIRPAFILNTFNFLSAHVMSAKRAPRRCPPVTLLSGRDCTWGRVNSGVDSGRQSSGRRLPAPIHVACPFYQAPGNVGPAFKPAFAAAIYQLPVVYPGWMSSPPPPPPPPPLPPPPPPPPPPPSDAPFASVSARLSLKPRDGVTGRPAPAVILRVSLYPCLQYRIHRG